ncbi:MAG: trypsin-like peptidase domain-containing protein [Alphaproteobacteria bacterium]
MKIIKTLMGILLLGFAFSTIAEVQTQADILSGQKEVIAPDAQAKLDKPPERMENIHLTFAPILKKVSPAIVNVSAIRQEEARSFFSNDPFFREFFGDLGSKNSRLSRSLGSAVVIDAQKGWVITNAHVINGATEISIILDDNKEYGASILWQDRRLDLAILVFDKKPENLVQLELDNSDALEVGDLVLAVGNPFGLGKTVTMGIISAVDRELAGSLGRFIQTDAAINPGNSGGGLITVDGKLAGLNTLIITKSGGSQGLGFAVPANLLKNIISQINDDGSRKQAWLGALFQDIDDELMKSLSLDTPGGAIVTNIWQESEAAKAGLKKGDVVVAVNGKLITGAQDLSLLEYYTAVDSVIELKLANGESLVFKAKEAPGNPPRNPVTVKSDGLFEGVTFINRSPRVSQQMRLPLGKKGIVISELSKNSLAAQMGFRKGDILIALNGQEFQNTDDIKKIDMRRGNRWMIKFERDGHLMSATIRY